VKILISSHCFAPSVGGIETVTNLLAEEWTAAGHELRIVTKTPDPSAGHHPFPVIRNPSVGRLFLELSWCDVYFQNNISLQTLWPALLIRKPTVIAHQTWLSHGFSGIMKRLACGLVGRISAISEAIRTKTGGDVVIPNPYQDDIFSEDPHSERDKDLIFVGRLVSDKGADLVIKALGILAQRGIHPKLTIVGEGPESAYLRELASASSLENQIVFAGRKQGPELASLLRHHRIMVVPSRWAEPFGIVALEGIACGCVVIGSDGGGLPQTIGPCGFLFPNGDYRLLALQLERLLIEGVELERLRESSQRRLHLELHTPARVSTQYLALFASLLGHNENPSCNPYRP
jgi:glycosyltransferase involved in cell wall biosynthesis